MVKNIVDGAVLGFAFIDVTRAEEDVAETAFDCENATEPEDVETTELVLDEGPGFVAPEACCIDILFSEMAPKNKIQTKSHPLTLTDTRSAVCTLRELAP